MQAGDGQGADQQITDELPIVDVEPFRIGDESTEVSRTCMRRRGENEVRVQACQFAGLDAQPGSGVPESGLPARLDVVVPDIGRIPQVEGRPSMVERLRDR